MKALIKAVVVGLMVLGLGLGCGKSPTSPELEGSSDPRIVITHPRHGATVSDIIRITVTSNIELKHMRVCFKSPCNDSTMIDADPPYSFMIDTRICGILEYRGEICAIGYNPGEAFLKDDIEVIVDNRD